MDLVAKAPISLVPAGGGGIIALLQGILQDLLRPELTAEERAILKSLEAASLEVGPYVLGAENREDILVRIDTLLDDPGYYQKVLSALIGNWPIGVSAAGRAAAADEPGELFPSVLGPFLGPAALPHLRDVQRSAGFFIKWMQAVAPTVTQEDVASAVRGFFVEPLSFVTSLPVPVARSLLAELRNDIFFVSAFALLFERRSVEPWLGLAFSELWATTSREALVLPASLGDIAVPLDLVPPEKRLDLAALKKAAALTEQAYARFNTDAESSGAPVYPPVS